MKDIELPPLLARIAELEAANEAFGKRQEWWNSRMLEMERELEEARKDAERWRAMRKHLVGVDFKPEMGGGPVVFFECFAASVSAGESGADAIADAAISKEQTAPQQQEPKCTCLTSQLGPSYCERCSP